MRILVACEESQQVAKRLRAKGHEAYSCDIIPCSGGHPEYHILQDVRFILDTPCSFLTADGKSHQVLKWDAILAFPPCTHLAISGARHFEQKRADGRQREAIMFFAEFLECKCDKVMIENPRNIISGDYILEHFPDLCKRYSLPLKPTQVIQPYYFGDKSRKTTCLWLKGLLPLTPTNIVEPELVHYNTADGRVVTFSKDYGSGGGENGKRRSKTYDGIADAIANQWF